MPALAFAQAQPSTSAIAFTLPDAGRSADWPVAVQGFRLDSPVRVHNGWVPTATITLRNVSPKTIVSGGMGFVFPEPGDGTQAHPRAACWSVQQGQVPKLVWLGHDGVYHLPPGWEHQKPLQLAPGTAIRLTFTKLRPGYRRRVRQRAAPPSRAQLPDVLFCRWFALVRRAVRAASAAWDALVENSPPRRVSALRKEQAVELLAFG